MNNGKHYINIDILIKVPFLLSSPWDLLVKIVLKSLGGVSLTSFVVFIAVFVAVFMAFIAFIALRQATTIQKHAGSGRNAGFNMFHI